jgi:hypothetical protein
VWKMDHQRATPVASSMQVRADVHLGRLTPDDVIVELYSGKVDLDGDLVEGRAIPMQPQAANRRHGELCSGDLDASQ